MGTLRLQGPLDLNQMSKKCLPKYWNVKKKYRFSCKIKNVLYPKGHLLTLWKKIWVWVILSFIQCWKLLFTLPDILDMLPTLWIVYSYLTDTITPKSKLCRNKNSKANNIMLGKILRAGSSPLNLQGRCKLTFWGHCYKSWGEFHRV